MILSSFQPFSSPPTNGLFHYNASLPRSMADKYHIPPKNISYSGRTALGGACDHCRKTPFSRDSVSMNLCPCLRASKPRFAKRQSRWLMEIGRRSLQAVIWVLGPTFVNDFFVILGNAFRQARKSDRINMRLSTGRANLQIAAFSHAHWANVGSRQFLGWKPQNHSQVEYIGLWCPVGTFGFIYRRNSIPEIAESGRVKTIRYLSHYKLILETPES